MVLTAESQGRWVPRVRLEEGDGPLAPATVINLGNVRWAITIMAVWKSSILIPVTYLALLCLMIYRGAKWYFITFFLLGLIPC